MKLDYGIPISLAGGAEVKATDGSWTVEGYASTFGNVDLGYDVILPGAFDKTLKEKPLRRIKFLHSHLPWEVLGIPLEMKTDQKGLFARFKISKTTLGTDVHTLVLDGALDSFSIGYRAKDVDHSENGDVRQIKEVELVEVSLVAMPMNPEALVTDAKNHQWNHGNHAPTLAELIASTHASTEEIVAITRELIAKHADLPDGELRNAKRRELEAISSALAELSGVSDELVAILATQPKSQSHVRLSLELARARARLREAHLID